MVTRSAHKSPGASDRPVEVLSTGSFGPNRLDALRAVSPRLVIRQHPAQSVPDVPQAAWDQAEVLYTYGVLPVPEQTPNLRWVQLDSAGIDHIVDSPIWRSEVVLTTLAGVAPTNMAEHALLMMLAFGHHLRQLIDLQARREWPALEDRRARFTPDELRGATVGIVGYGSIGRELGRIAHALGMRVIAVTRQGSVNTPSLRYQVRGLEALPGTTPDEVVPPEGLRSVAATCDYLVMLCPHTAATHHLVDETVLRSMKRGSVLINIARGGVVDEAALVRVLDDGWLGGAALDVFEDEPLPADSPLWSMDRVIISPHVAGFTAGYDQRVGELFEENLRRYLADEPLLNEVDRDRGY